VGWQAALGKALQWEPPQVAWEGQWQATSANVTTGTAATAGNNGTDATTDADTGIITVAADKDCGLGGARQRRDGYRTDFGFSGLHVRSSFMMSHNLMVRTHDC
jgi:hypothetical protein